MEFIIGQAITIVIVIGGFLWNASYIRGNFTARLNNAEDDIDNLKKNVRYKDTCNAISQGLETRIDRLETAANGK